MSNVCQIFIILTLDTLDNMLYTLYILASNVGREPRDGIMARAFIGKAEAERLRSHKFSSTVQQESICSRCGGLMVSDFCMDLLNSTGELDFAAKRCVQCGEVVDPVILRNRETQQVPMTVHPTSMLSI